MITLIPVDNEAQRLKGLAIALDMQLGISEQQQRYESIQRDWMTLITLLDKSLIEQEIARLSAKIPHSYTNKGVRK